MVLGLKDTVVEDVVVDRQERGRKSRREVAVLVVRVRPASQVSTTECGAGATVGETVANLAAKGRCPPLGGQQELKAIREVAGDHRSTSASQSLAVPPKPDYRAGTAAPPRPATTHSCPHRYRST
jgi:hypothetical protein